MQNTWKVKVDKMTSSRAGLQGSVGIVHMRPEWAAFLTLPLQLPRCPTGPRLQQPGLSCWVLRTAKFNVRPGAQVLWAGCFGKGWPSLCTFWLPLPTSHKSDTGPHHSKTWVQPSRSVTLTPHLSQPWQNARESPTISSPSLSTASPIGVPLGLHTPLPRWDTCFLLTATSISIQRGFGWRYKSPQTINDARHCSSNDRTLGGKRNGLAGGTVLSCSQLVAGD